MPTHAAHLRGSSRSSDQRSSSFPSTNTHWARSRGRAGWFAFSVCEQVSLEAKIDVRGRKRSLRAVSIKRISSALLRMFLLRPLDRRCCRSWLWFAAKNVATSDLLRDENGRIQSWTCSRPHLRLPERRGEKRCSEDPNYRFTYALYGPRASRYSEVGLCFLSYTFRRGVKRRMREEHFALRRSKRPDGPGGSSASKICVGSHSSKLQHRAPLEIRSNLSHVRKTLESGIPVPPSATSLDVVEQWLLCCAGASPTEGPYTETQRETRVFSMKLFWI